MVLSSSFRIFEASLENSARAVQISVNWHYNRPIPTCDGSLYKYFKRATPKEVAMGEKKKEDKESKAQKGEENQQENLASTQKKVNTN